ncbi:myelin-associated glycoprotein isoform X1 [Podarcis lilfordi]|uniref:Myelin-associated glycoprotein isoform X1 n=1 Tax=Podarcis lilfordi TaxID=74358 RepID=A0AA35P9X3_9SAUR|nr:myelin-associated glycoprotein isoform X1 [Podarcis lilfordi]
MGITVACTGCRGRSWQVANSPSKTKLLASSLATVATVILTLLCKGMLTNNLDFRITVPDSITAQRGFCIHVPCSFTTPDWYKSSSEPLYGYWFRITDRQTNLEGTNIWVPGEFKASRDERQRFLKFHSTHMKLSGDPEKGDCSFTIINAGLDDWGQYHFRIDKGESYRYSFNPSSSQTHTNPQVVLTDLKKPKIIKPHEVIWEKPATFRCIAAEMCPGTKPQITWHTEPDIHPVYATSSWNTQQSNWSSTYGVDITFKPSLADDGIVLTCNIKYHFLKKAVHVATRLSFGYRPTASTILPNATCENEDQGRRCTCSFHCWPPPTLTWEVDGVTVTGNGSTSDMEVLHWAEGNAASSTLLWKGASIDHYDPFITCTATNPFGKQTVVILPGSNQTSEHHLPQTSPLSPVHANIYKSPRQADLGGLS